MRIGEQYIRHRAFSALGPLQKAHRIRYSLELSAQHTATYGVEVESEDAMRRETHVVQGLCGPKARWILEYLYENAVPAEHWRDILEDLVVQI